MTRIVKSPEERKAELIEVATKLFFEKGYNETTVRDIIKAINGSQGMFYHYFSSKDEIYHAVMNEYINKYINGLNDISQNIELSFFERIIRILKEFKKTYNTCLNIKNYSNNPENIYFNLELKERILHDMVIIIDRLIQDGIEYKIINPEIIVNQDTKKIADYIANGIYGIINCDINNKSDIEEVNDRTIKEVLVYSFRVLGINENQVNNMIF